MKPKGNEPAFPTDTLPHAAGLTKREYFAVKAMQALLSVDNGWDTKEVMEGSVNCADALIEELGLE